MSPAQTVALLAALALGAPEAAHAAAAKKKQPPAPAPAPVQPPPADCSAMAECRTRVEERFSATDFEAASLLARKAEAFATTDAERARLVLLQAALLFHSAGTPTPEAEQLIVSRLELARKLDPTLTALSIPPYARSQRLEALWERALPPLPPRKEVVVVQSPPPVPPVEVVVEPRRAPVLPVVLTALGIAGVAAGGVFTGLFLDAKSRTGPMTIDTMNVALWRDAETYGTVFITAFSVAGVALLAALVTWLVR